jgi:PEP-CTERM motif
MLSRVMMAAVGFAALLAPIQVAAAPVSFNFDVVVDYSDARLPGVVEGAIGSIKVRYDDASILGIGFEDLTDPNLFDITMRLGTLSLTENDAAPGAVILTIVDGIFDSFSLDLPDVPFPIESANDENAFDNLRISLSTSFFGDRRVNVDNLDSFVGATPTPRASGVATVSEPGTLALLSLGLFGLALRRRAQG